MAGVQELEITIGPRAGDTWPVDVEWRSPGATERGAEGVLSLDPAALSAATADPRAYGTVLGQALFAGPEVRSLFDRARERAEGPLHVLLGVKDPELRALRWERLCGPVDGAWPFLLLDQRTPLSLYVKTRAEGAFPALGRLDLRALVVVANPEGLERYRLERFDAEAALEAVLRALGDIPVDVLAGVGRAVGPPTVDALVERLTDKPYSLVHVVAHGVVGSGGETALLLHDAGGAVDRVTGAMLVDRARGLGGKGGLPRLLFLAACETAAPAAEGALGGLGHRLVGEVGIPAVVAMTDRVRVETAEALAAPFYRRLVHHGYPDLALAEASASLDPRRHSIAVPVLVGGLGGRALFQGGLEQLGGEAVSRERDEVLAASERRRAERERVVGLPAPDLGDRFLGRADEVRSLSAWLADPATRLLSVIGRPGIGKTALASRVLGELEAFRWPHTGARDPAVEGIVYLSSSHTAPITLEQVFQQCRRLLLPEAQTHLDRVWGSGTLPTVEKVDRLLEMLADGPVVILLDYAQELLDEDGRVADDDLRTFVDRCVMAGREVRLLVTSRQPLALPPEAVSVDRRLQLDEGLSVEDGVAMLRGLDLSGEGGIANLTDEQLREAVERLDGVPRALELLASVLRDEPWSSFEEILAGFFAEDPVAALMREAYRRLGPTELHVMEVLAVLGRPVTAAAVSFVLAAFEPDADVPAVLRRLLRLAMVKADRATRTVSLTRLDQDYLLGLIEEDGEVGRRPLERRAAEWYERLQVPSTSWNSLLDLEPHLLEYAHRRDAGDAHEAALVLFDIDRFLIWNGHARRALGMHLELDPLLRDPRLRMLNAFGTGDARLVLGPLPDAVAAFEATRALALEVGDPERARRATAKMGEAYRRLGRREEAIENLEQATAHYDPDLAPPEESGFLSLGLTYAYAGRLDDAERAGTRLLSLAGSAGSRLGEAEAHDVLALASLARGRLEETIEHAKAASLGYRNAGERDPEGYVANVIGMALIRLGRPEQARPWLERGREIGSQENPRLEGFCLFNLARAAWVEGDVGGAADMAGLAVERFESMKAAETVAAGALRRAIESEGRGDAAGLVEALLACAEASAANPDLLSPADLLDRAEALAQEQGMAAAVGRVSELRRSVA